jgi:hypothetical protein
LHRPKPSARPRSSCWPGAARTRKETTARGCAERRLPGGAAQFDLAAEENQAEVALIIGDHFDVAIKALREVAGRLAVLHDKCFYMPALASLATVLLKAAPLIVRDGFGARDAATASLGGGARRAVARIGTAARMRRGCSGRARGECARSGGSPTRGQGLQRLHVRSCPTDIDGAPRRGSSPGVDDACRVALVAEEGSHLPVELLRPGRAS